MRRLLHQRVLQYIASAEALIRECMARFTYSREEAIENLKAFGGI
jgi:hypothetical protein